MYMLSSGLCEYHIDYIWYSYNLSYSDRLSDFLSMRKVSFTKRINFLFWVIFEKKEEFSIKMKLRLISKKYAVDLAKQFPTNSFYGLKSSTKPPASVGVKNFHFILILKFEFHNLNFRWVAGLCVSLSKWFVKIFTSKIMKLSKSETF